MVDTGVMHTDRRYTGLATLVGDEYRQTHGRSGVVIIVARVVPVSMVVCDRFRSTANNGVNVHSLPRSH